MHAVSLAFNRPETECREPGRGRPIDLDHLANQTLGQKDLESEVLGLFSRQVRQCMRAFDDASEKERVDLAHALKGSARGVGAFALAECADRVEQNPGDHAALEDLAAAAVAVETFLSRLTR